jgi:hypothetical protein
MLVQTVKFVVCTVVWNERDCHKYSGTHYVIRCIIQIGAVSTRPNTYKIKSPALIPSRAERENTENWVYEYRQPLR